MGGCGLFSEEPGLWASSLGAAGQVFHCSITQSNDMGKINNLLQRAVAASVCRIMWHLSSWWCSYIPLPQHWWISKSQTNLSQLQGQTPRASLVKFSSASASDPTGLLTRCEARVWKGTLAWKHPQRGCNIFVEGAARDVSLGLSAPWWRQNLT